MVTFNVASAWLAASSTVQGEAAKQLAGESRGEDHYPDDGSSPEAAGTFCSYACCHHDQPAYPLQKSDLANSALNLATDISRVSSESWS